MNVALDSTEYLKVYNENHIGTLLWMFLGIIHPVIVGIYCCYALKHIHSLRPVSELIIICSYLWKLTFTRLIECNFDLYSSIIESHFSLWFL